MPAFRLDRLASLYVFYPFRGWKRNRGIPILMYHSISDDQATDVHPYYRTETSGEVFRQHMAFLHDHHYSVVNLHDAFQPLHQPRPASQPVVITFDDAYQDFYANAFPVLRQYSFPATVFVPTRYIADAPQSFKGKPALTWGEIRELHGAGIQFGSHTVSHPQLWCLHRSDIERELRESKFTLEDKLGSEVRSFAYPFAFPEQDGRFAATLRRTLQACGYEMGVSTILGTAHASDERFFLPRLPINSCDDPALFQAKIAGAYDWLHVPQYVRKAREGGDPPRAAASAEGATA